jgi:symplekin
MHQYIERLAQSRLDVFDESSRKRGLPVEPTDGLDNAKRARLGVDTPPLLKIPPLPPGPTSWAQLFTLTDDVGLSSFDVKQLPIDLIVKITVPVLCRVDSNALNQAIEVSLVLCGRSEKGADRHQAIRARYQTLVVQQKQAPAHTVEEDDEYEPEYQPMDVPAGDNLQSETALEGSLDLEPDLVSLGPFVLPQPPPLSEYEAGEIGRSTVERVFGMVVSMPSKTVAKNANQQQQQQQLGFSRLAGSSFDRDAWVTLLTRLATRASAGLEVDSSGTENGVSRQRPAISDTIRDVLYRYILEDFRSRINVGITWLNEEWYNDRIQLKFVGSHRDEDEEVTVPTHYDRWVLRLLDGFLPYLDARDKVLIRFLSEIPELTPSIVARVQSLARDPERVNLCVQALM